MQRLKLSPFFHPTTVVLVDDNESFLHSLDLEMPSTLAFHGFTTAEAALEFCNRPPDLAPLTDRCFTLDHSNESEAVIHMDLGLIEQEISHLQRFRRISVMLVDYAMPSVDGLEFCARVRDPWARRVLLTGVADEKQAVEAFNAGLIHRYIPKQRTTTAEALMAYVAELEREYFEQYQSRLAAALAMNPPGFLVDADVAVHVRRFIHQENIAEYYLVNDPPGFLMLRADGTVIRLVLLDEGARKRQIELVHRHDAPGGIRRGIERGEVIGLFSGESPDDYFGEEVYPWAEQVVAARPVPGAPQWLHAVVRDAATDIDFDPTESSYATYLRRLGRG